MFLPMLQDVSSKPIRDTVDDFVEGLKHFDKVNIEFIFDLRIMIILMQEGNGLISAVELRHLLTGLGEKMSEEEVGIYFGYIFFMYEIFFLKVESLIHGKEDSQGNINYEEFVKMVLAQ